MHLERYTRQTEATWEYRSSKNTDAVLKLSSIQCQLPLANIYPKIEFDSRDEGKEGLKVIEEKTSYLPIR